jgi:UDP-glucuronate 4-epimerase
MKRIAITGAAGFIGSSLTDELLARNIKVSGIDNFNDFYDPAAKRKNLEGALKSKLFALTDGDIRDPAVLKGTVSGCDAVVHLAAMAGVRPSMKDPDLYRDVNINGTRGVLEACRQAGVRNVIYASSSSVYGNNEKVPFAESDPVDNPQSVYAETKIAAENLCKESNVKYGLDITCLRLFTVYGPRQRPDLAICKFSRLILDDKPIPFFGDGSMERDHTYIGDILFGLQSAIDNNPGCGFRIINLGSDRPVRLDALLDAIEKALGKKAVLDRQPVPQGDVRRTWADLTRARDLLGYEPRTALEDGLRLFADWIRDILKCRGLP